MMRLFLVRHGQSEWNAGRRLQGQADTALSDHGRNQARALAATVQALQPERIIASDLTRTRETANLLGYGEHETDSNLREIDVGAWSGRAIEDLMAEDEAAFLGWRAGTYTPPQGESWRRFKARSLVALADARETAARSVLLVIHGGVIRALLEGLLDLSPARIVPVGPASLTVLRLDEPNGTASARLEVFNYTPDAPVFNAPD